MDNRDLRARALDILSAALDAAHPHQLLNEALTLRGTLLEVRGVNGSQETVDLAGVGRVVVVGAGKATAPMAQALEELLGERLEGGIISVKYGHALPLERIEVREAGHPIPDQAGLEATARIREMLVGLGEGDLVFVLLSGGGSALLDAYSEGITLEQAQEAFGALLASGAPIEEMNVVRKHISQVKGGQLARAAFPARVITLVLSDIIGDPLASIASGPTVPDPSTYEEALEILNRRGVLNRVPNKIRRHLQRGAAGQIPETPKPGEPGWEGAATFLIGNNRRAVEAAAGRARRLGLRPRVLTTGMEGEAAEVGRRLAEMGLTCLQVGEPAVPPCCLIAGGETTVTLHGAHGRGGRSQELALAAALVLEGSRGVVLLAAGTDGTDGPTDAAGGIVDGETVRQAYRGGADPGAALLAHDAYPCLEAASALIITGPTMTNVMDLVLVLAADE